MLNIYKHVTLCCITSVFLIFYLVFATAPVQTLDSMVATPKERLLGLVEKQTVVRPKDVEALDIPRTYLYRLRDEGILEQVGRGAFALANREITENNALAVVQTCVPTSVTCLLSALRFHDLTTQAPSETWIAIDVHGWRPSFDYPPLRTVYMSGKARTEGVETHQIEGIEVRIFSAAKTVADCFKYRHKIGIDIAIEALRDYHRTKNSMDDVWRYARVCRVKNVLRPYLESLV